MPSEGVAELASSTVGPTLLESYQQHLALKTESTRTGLRHLGYGELFQGITPCHLVRGFRGRADFAIRWHDNDCQVSGVSPSAGREAPLGETLWALPRDIRARVVRLAELLLANGAAWPVEGFEIRLAYGSDKFHVLLSVMRTSTASYGSFAERLMREIEGVSGVAIPSKKIEIGETFLQHNLQGHSICAHYAAFFQNNFQLLGELVAYMKEQFCQNHQRVLDLYCGVGLHSLLVAAPKTDVLGADFNRAAIESARRNACSAQMTRARYVCQTVERFVEEQELERPDLIIANPPRPGMGTAVISRAAEMKAGRIAVVSCCPKTHFDDLRTWKQRGYVATRIAAFDMFPFTSFLETVTTLERG